MRRRPLIIIFSILLIVITFSDLINSDNKFSERENRHLKEKPEFTLESFKKGKFFKDYESYINDQFVMRDTWIDLKSTSEYLLSKKENNGILYGKDDFLFNKNFSYNSKILNNNIFSINEFANKYSKEIDFLIIPNSYEIYKDKMPYTSMQINQKNEIENVKKQLESNIKNYDTIALLNKYKDNYIYYKTDHHWTTLGAYIVYKDYIESKGLEPLKYVQEDFQRVNDFYGTYYSKGKPWWNSSDYINYKNIDNLYIEVDGKRLESLYDFTKFQSVDKYGGFLHGNNGLSIIKNSNISSDRRGEKLLVIKDSFANCFIPFLTHNYEEIYIVDLRSLTFNLSQLYDNIDFQDIILLYNFESLSTDTNITKVKR